MLGFHYLAPTLTVGCLLFGILCAVGHHYFYLSLDGRPAPTLFDNMKIAGMEVSHQQFNTAIGTTFAFLVRSLLGFAISLSYFQLVMRAMMGSGDTRTKVGHLDVLFSALENIFTLGHPALWRQRPLLFVVAAVAWFLPLASIITPATLSVGTAFPPSQLLDVPHIGLASLNMLSDMFRVANSTLENQLFYYNGPSSAVRRIVFATAAQGAILPVQAPAANSSWSFTFAAPVLQCRDLTSTTKRAIGASMLEYMLPPDQMGCAHTPGFMAWHPYNLSAESSVQDILPFKRQNGNGTIFFDDRPYNDQRYLSGSEQSGLFIAATGWSLIDRLCPDDGSQGSVEGILDHFNSSTMLKCEVHNATYHTEFSFVDGTQQVTVHTSHISEAAVIGQPGVQILSESQESAPGAACEPPTQNGTMLAAPPCFFDASLLRTLSYQAMMDSLSELLSGLVCRRNEWDLVFASNSSVANTVLTSTPELDFLEDYRTVSHPDSLFDLAQTWSERPFAGIVHQMSQHRRRSLKDAMERLFINITISLMSSPELQYNTSSAFYPPPTQVKFEMRNDIYAYSPQKLALAYGVAIGASAMIVGLGLASVIVRKASFSNNFSTIFRLSRGASTDTDFDDDDLDGRVPLPERIRQAKVSFRDVGQTKPRSGNCEALRERSAEVINVPLHVIVSEQTLCPDNVTDGGRSSQS
ncbi:uncharacterized protein CLAFUR5_11789 [Fulvia fulva]|uniref:Uncharacterized protein n=1 Tax=Passalora fulva TaxID=5499 RepID=A0A9Q8UUE9_PASFU|nr:uncharacterized protein CLAFUR5_11789 [Fulvia fulva]KAK4628093.1 hypothetical protein CLAFUR0_05108 [Fulvia fulva]UJO22825.1 hypothetical protein CLAFUR5_11789 [Fulvia fulva]WPV28750.1 hypothetical protein CLAFUW7_05112 [Fulvia fulva]